MTDKQKEAAPTGTGEGSEPFETWFDKHYYAIDPIAKRTIKAAYEAGGASLRSQLAEMTKRAKIAESIARDTDAAERALRSQLEETLNTLGKLKIKYPTIRHSDEKWRQIEAKLKRDLATAQARIAELRKKLNLT